MKPASELLIIRRLHDGETIRHGNFAGYLIGRGKAMRVVLKATIDALEARGIVKRIDDRTSCVGEEWGLA